MKRILITVLLSLIVVLILLFKFANYLTNNVINDNTKNYLATSKSNIISGYHNQDILEKKSINILFFGDFIYDRGVKQYLNNSYKINNKLNEYFENIPNNYWSAKNGTNMFTGINFVGFNLEMPAVKDKNVCLKTGKTVAFCGDATILDNLSKVGFNIVNIANNHSMDGGINAHKQTIQNLNESKIKYFGYIRHGKYFEQNYIYTGTIYDLNFAWHGFDFTITNKSFEVYCQILKEYKSLNYINFVNTHWGKEYENIQNENQIQLGKKMIDCGADLIIGHHPHVVQGNQYYNGKLIIYSLGNFLFDQGKVEDTKTGMFALIKYQINGDSILLTGNINSYFK